MKPKTKLPWLAKYLFSFLFVAVFFVLASHLAKAAYAVDCWVNTTVAITPGETVNVGTNFFDPAKQTASIVLNPGTNVLTPPVTLSSASGATATDYATPSKITAGKYNAVMVINTSGSINFTNCQGGIGTSGGFGSGSGEVDIQNAPGFQITSANISGSSVTFSFNTAANANLALVVYDSTNKSVGDSGSLGTASNWTWDATGQPAGDYHAQVFAFGTTPFSNVYPFTLSGSSPPPTAGCPTTSGAFSLTVAVSGNNVQFGMNPVPATGQQVVIHVIHDPNTGTAAWDSPTGVSSSPVNWNSAPDGKYCAAMTYLTSSVSNTVSFTVPSSTTEGAGTTCPVDTSTAWTNGMYKDAINNSYFDNSIFTIGQSANVVDSLDVMLWGCSLLTPQINKISQSKGALALSGSVLASLYAAPPASGVTYFAQKIHDLNPVHTAFAEAGGTYPGGIGYQALGPVQKIWVAFRNISYVGFILVFVIIGFMIMFRAHISPQAVATVQDSIPRLVVALILVTFSYAIAGFMIDIMFLSLNIIVQALAAVHLIGNVDYVFKDNVFTVIWGSWRDIFATVASAIYSIIKDAISLPDFLKSIFGWAGAGLAAIVVGIAILFLMFRVFFMLLMAYVTIILLTIFAPFFFLIQALPGNNGAKEWFRQMASNVAVFPVVALMFMLAGIVGGIGALGGNGGAIQPAQVGQFPLLIGGLPTEAIGRLIGIGFLLMTPAAADIVKNAFGNKGGGLGNFGAAAATLGAGMAVAGAAGRGAGNAVWNGNQSPIGKWRQVRAAKHADDIQFKAEAGIYNKRPRPPQRQLDNAEAGRDA